MLLPTCPQPLLVFPVWSCCPRRAAQAEAPSPLLLLISCVKDNFKIAQDAYVCFYFQLSKTCKADLYLRDKNKKHRINLKLCYSRHQHFRFKQYLPGRWANKMDENRLRQIPTKILRIVPRPRLTL